MEEWLREWREQIVPLRKKFGFRIAGAWRIGEERFVWIPAIDGSLDEFERAERNYYESPERKALDPTPTRHLTHIDLWMMTSVFEP